MTSSGPLGRRATWISIRARPDGPRVEGTQAVRLEHPVPRPDRGPQVRDGVWADWDWDGRRLKLQTSPHGFLPLYYFADRDVISISTSVYDLLRVAPPEIDWPAMAVMLRLGFFIGDRGWASSTRSSR